MRRSLVGALVLIAGCSSLTRYEPATYTVRPGDTLYSIAFRQGLDYRELAAWNGIADPSRLSVGQRLVLRANGAAATPPAARAQTTPASPPAAGAPTRPPASQPGASSASRTASAPAPAPARAPARSATSAAPSWRWPVRGPIVSRFGARGALATGIGIGGQVGQDIVAAAPGRVVYAGSGLADYGRLIIIQHNETWLSAYGHNDRVLVSQGDQVAAGQKIAEMGTGPGGKPLLHFEIRRNGDPLDPLKLLPGSG
jgi:lipoprotein NlpD